jgi:ribosomal-protein-alanine N-acetyltransferase
MIVFETERLSVRYLRDDDFPMLHALCTDPAVYRYMGDGQPLSAESVRQWIAISQENYQKRGYGCFAIDARAGDEMIGYGGIAYLQDGAQIEIIYAFAPAHWGQGLASEFVRGLLAASFTQWHIPRIEASVHPDNSASIAVITKAGMTWSRTVVEEDGTHVQFYGTDNPGMDAATSPAVPR